jgi:membrane protease subunit HflC
MIGTFRPLSLVTFGVIGTVLFLSMFTVNETERVVINRLGRLIVDEKTKQPEVLLPGLHFKMPLVDNILRFDYRIQTLLIPNSRIPTSEKKELIIDLFAKWKIRDLSKFYQSTKGDIRNAETLLRQKVMEALRTEIGRRNLNNVVSHERQAVLDILRIEADKTAETLGVKVVDVRIVRLDLPEEVNESVYNLMRTERQRVATEHRARGQARAETIRADADAQVTILMANAEREAKTARGTGDAIAAKISSEAYGQDPEFYSFYRSLEAYKQAFNNDQSTDMMVVKPDGDFFKYFHKKKNGNSNVAASKSANKK